MKKLSITKQIITTILLVCMILFNVSSVKAASIPNWKNLYQSKVQQIENEYKQGKRTKDNEYNISHYSLQDIDFDGVPELYHTLVAKRDNGFELQEGMCGFCRIIQTTIAMAQLSYCPKPTNTISDTLKQLHPLVKIWATRDGNVTVAVVLKKGTTQKQWDTIMKILPFVKRLASKAVWY